MNVLSIDWDFFFVNPWRMKMATIRRLGLEKQAMMTDWGHAENGMHWEFVWGPRALTFFSQDVALPGLSGEEIGFWDRFRFSPKVKTFWAESHSQIVDARVMGRQHHLLSLWNFDAHHDAGYRKESLPTIANGEVSCEDWLAYLSFRGADCHVRYPKWATGSFEAEPVPLALIDRKFDRRETLPVFDRVFICRSGCWVPPWCDEKFVTLLGQAPGKLTQVDDIPLRRRFDEAAWRASAQTMNEGLAVLKPMADAL